jgi:hypothetical protein
MERYQLLEDQMVERFGSLFGYEKHELLEVLRRDFRAETCKSITDPDNAAHHQSNCRVILRILEVLNPKRAEYEVMRHGPSAGAASIPDKADCEMRSLIA